MSHATAALTRITALVLTLAQLTACSRGGAAHSLPSAGGEDDLDSLNDQSWNQVTGGGWNYLRRSSSKDGDIVVDSTAPFSPPNVLRIVFTPDMRRDHEPSVYWIPLPKVKEVRTVWWIKLSPNWTPSPAGGGKMTFLHAWPNGQGQVYTAFHGSQAPHWIIVNTEWAPYGQKIWAPNVSRTQISYNRWYGIDWYVKWESSPGAGDGILRWWVDGKLNGEYTDVEFPVNGIGFQQFEFAPTLQNPPPADQYMYVDHTGISAR